MLINFQLNSGPNAVTVAVNAANVLYIQEAGGGFVQIHFVGSNTPLAVLGTLTTVRDKLNGGLTALHNG